MPINSKKIKERIKELGLTQGDAAKALGLAQSTASQKINNIRSMSVDEAEKLAELLKIGDQDFCIYFCMRSGGGGGSMNKIKKVELRQLATRNPIAAELAKATVETAAKVGANANELDIACELAREVYRDARDNSAERLSGYKHKALAILDEIT